MVDGNRNPEREADPEKLAKLLEMELMQKRAAWQQGKQRRNAMRVASFFFLFLVMIAALVAFWFLFSPDRISELRSNHATPAPSPTPLASPH